MTQADGMSPARGEYVRVVSTTPASVFTPVETFEQIPGNPYFESRRWGRLAFQEPCGPHTEALGVQHAYRTAGNDAEYDLLRHSYAAGDLNVTVTESRVFLHCAFRGKSASVGDALQRAGVVTAAFLNVESPVTYQWIDTAAKQGWCSTAPDLDWKGLERWSTRIDASVTEDGVDLLIYKVTPEQDPRFVNPSDWFPMNFRGQR